MKHMKHMKHVFVTHPRGRLEDYFGDKAVAALAAVAGASFNPLDRELSTPELIEAARGCDAIIAYRQTPAPHELFANLPRLAAFLRCAVDIRTVDVAAAGEHGVLVTQASAGFVPAVAEWVLGAMLDLARSTTAYAGAYHGGLQPEPVMGRELRGATLGIIGYGRISRRLGELGVALGMRVLVADPHVEVSGHGLRQVELPALLAAADFVVCLAAATAQTANLMNAGAFAALRPGAYFINASRGELVDEQAPGRLRAGRGPRRGPDAHARTGAPPARHRHAPCGRPYPGGHRAPGIGDRGPGRGDLPGQDSARRGECGASHAAAEMGCRCRSAGPRALG
jgi:D-3-phosphoglycerate dehydrogenase